MSLQLLTDIDLDNASRIINSPTPLSSSDVANAGYVDAQIISDSVDDGNNFTISLKRQMINFTMLSLDGNLNLEGDLWLA
jgi:hypothetical protein